MYQLLHNRVFNSWTPVVQDLATFALNYVVSSSLLPVNFTLLEFIIHTTYIRTCMQREIHGQCMDIAHRHMYSITHVYKDTDKYRYIHKRIQILRLTHVHMHTHALTHIHSTHTHMQTYTHIHGYTHALIHIHTRRCPHTYTPASAHTNTYALKYAYGDTHTGTHTRRHTLVLGRGIARPRHTRASGHFALPSPAFSAIKMAYKL